MSPANLANSVAALLLLLFSLSIATAFTTIPPNPPLRRPETELFTEKEASTLDRRNFLALAAALVVVPVSNARAADATTAASLIIQEVETTRQKLEPIPGLLQAGEWDQVRTILKSPPVNLLWNMGNSKNPILKLAQITDEIELIDLKDEISISLQMCDQLTYDNVFVYFQPGNGKVKVKEPLDLAFKAMKQIDDALRIAKESL